MQYNLFMETQNLTLAFPPALLSAIRSKAKKMGLSISEFIRTELRKSVGDSRTSASAGEDLIAALNDAGGKSSGTYKWSRDDAYES